MEHFYSEFNFFRGDVMQVLSIDVGYGHTKCMFKGETFKFPTAISHAGIGATNFVATDAYEFEGNRYFVGDSKAVRDGLPTSDFSFLKKYAPLLVYKAIEISAEKYGLDLTKEITVATGLSVLNWHERDGFKERLMAIEVNAKKVLCNIKLFAQGQGVFYDYFGVKGEDDLNIVFDIGYLTNDFIVFEGNKPYQEKCFANDKGINKIIADLQNFVTAEYKITSIAESKINEVLMTGKLRHFGEVVDLSKEIKHLKESYIDEVILSLQAKSKDLVRDANKIILAGGGAYLFQDMQIFPNLVLSKPQYEFANVRGYALKAVEIVKDL